MSRDYTQQAQELTGEKPDFGEGKAMRGCVCVTVCVCVSVEEVCKGRW